MSNTDNCELSYYLSQMYRSDAVCHLETVSASPIQQCSVYPDKQNPIKQVERIQLEYRQETNDCVNTSSIWNALAGVIDQTHLISNNSLKRSNSQFITRTLRDYLSDRTIHSFLTGRRIYPLMELLDKQKVKFEKKHQNALGYFVSFLLDEEIAVLGNKYRWNEDCKESNISLTCNKDGFWKVE